MRDYTDTDYNANEMASIVDLLNDLRGLDNTDEVADIADHLDTAIESLLAVTNRAWRHEYDNKGRPGWMDCRL
jgi:hypothetical protein